MPRFALTILAVLTLFVASAPAQKPSEKKEPGKPQSAVAAKDKSFATVSAEDAVVKAALKADDLAGAKKQIDKTSTFTGTVAKVFLPDSNSVVLINFAKNYKEALTVVVYARNFAKFPNLNTLRGKKVVVTGKVSDYKGQPQVELTDVSALKIVK
jgi:DNA/RNA endonuclease YhcR with UshA esterase domain